MAPQQAGMPVAAGESAHVQHFARLVAVWLEKEAQRHQAGCVHLLAEKHIMVALRDACSPLLRRMVRERTGPFRSGGARELAADPAVGALVPGPRQESRS